MREQTLKRYELVPKRGGEIHWIESEQGPIVTFADIAPLLADQERMREALNTLERERGEFRLALVQALAMGDGVTQDAQIIVAVQEHAAEAEGWVRIAEQDAKDAKTEQARLLSEAWWSGRNSIRKFPPEIATGPQLQQACSDALDALSTPRQP